MRQIVREVWIAAAAMDKAACLLTFDRDYEHVAGLDYLLLEGVEPGTEDD